MSPPNIHKLFPVEAQDRDGRLPPPELFIVGTLALLQRDCGDHAIEIGTLYGETTSNIARAMPRHVVITVDIPPDQEPSLPAGEINRKLIGKTPTFDPAVASRIIALRTDSAKLVLDKGIDLGFAFIDGAHSREYALNDFYKIKPHLVEGAIVCFHDVGLWTGVGPAVEEIMDAHPTWQWSSFEGTSLAWGRKL